MLTASLMVNDLSHASPQPSKAAATSPTSGKTDAVHLVVHSGPEAKQIFTYFPYPDIPAQYRFAKISGTGIYRLMVSPQGNVVEIKILKKMGVFGDWPADVTALKTLIHWRAQPGPASHCGRSVEHYPRPPLYYQRRIAYPKALTL
jgi:hypothetical protein